MSDRLPAPPGWYPHGHVLRYWDGEHWTERAAPKPRPPRRTKSGRPSAPQTGSDAPDPLVFIGYALAFVFPIAGVIVGRHVSAEPDRASNRHGRWIIGLSAVLFCAEVMAILAATGTLG